MSEGEWKAAPKAFNARAGGKSRRASIIRDKSGNARQTLITRGPSSIRRHQRTTVPQKESWTQSPMHLVGKGDSVMIEDYTNEAAFVKNLKDRYDSDAIYTYIRGVCISINPYQDLGIYTSKLIDEYFGAQLFELPPHLYAIANQAYYAMKEENTDQCILISGESGAGKTEAAKQVLQFLASTATNSGLSRSIRDRLLQSNPILEAFGNAKTLRNDNSSRFGKYMEVQFDFKGEPTGGKIINYLLEKSRVVRQMDGERNFHVFYMVLADSIAAGDRQLTGAGDHYHYTSQGGIIKVDTLNDEDEMHNMTDAMTSLGFADGEKKALLDLVAFVLKLGQIEFESSDEDAAGVADELTAAEAESQIGLSEGCLTKCLTTNSITTRGETIVSPLTGDQAQHARDALGKAVYYRAFDWLVNRLNTSLDQNSAAGGKGGKSKGGQKGSRSTVMGLLDIYGFEILAQNGFEQICINYCNEKLQQLFIELTLKSEQLEYKKEGIEWVPVEYFDNHVLCAFIESTKEPMGLLTTLDDCCLGPGNKKDPDFLQTLDLHFKGSEHYASFANNKSVERDQFVVKHYAGDVAYTVDGFIDANNDLLLRDLKVAMTEATNIIVVDRFPKAELESRKRPATAGTEFRKNMNDLMDTLMQKMPSYVRCIKPNGEKKANKWDADHVQHQVKYLGLMENLRVARAGYCYRRPFEMFLERYKSLCPETWPSWNGSAKDGVKVMAAHFMKSAPRDPSPWVKPTHHLGLGDGEIAVGVRTKVFVRSPKSVTAIEMAFQKHKNHLATKVIAAWKGKKQRTIYLRILAQRKIAAHWRGYKQRKIYQALRPAVLKAQMWARVVLAKKEVIVRNEAAGKIRNFVKGFMQRNEAPNEFNKLFVPLARQKFLLNLVASIPKTILGTGWISPKLVPKSCLEVSGMLRKLVHTNNCRKYRLKLSPEQKHQLTLKFVAEVLFSRKKASYPSSVGLSFTNNRIEDLESFAGAKEAFAKTKTPEEEIMYSTLLHKFDRSTYKHKRDDVVIVTQTHIRVFGEAPKYKEKIALPLQDMVGIYVSNLSDGCIVIRTPGNAGKAKDEKLKGDKGDFIFDTPHVIEFATYIIHTLAVKPGPPSPLGEQSLGVSEKCAEKLTIANPLMPALKGGKPGKILFAAGEAGFAIVKDEGKKALQITAPETHTTEAFAGRVRSSLRLRAKKEDK